MARFSQGSGSSNSSAPLNYVQVAGTQQIISSAPNSIVDLNITTTGAPVQISVTGEGANASAGSWLRLNLFRNNVEIGNAIQMESSAASENVPFAINFIDDVAAGTYNYSARVTTINGGSWTFGEAAGPVINAIELNGFEGDRGPRGFTGDDGAPALWNYTGEYSGGSSYAVGDVVTYDGQLWYRANANGGNVGDTPSEGFIWDLLAAKGADGEDASGGLVFLGNYISGNGYVANIAVVRGSDDNLYIATSSGGLADPVGNTAEWSIFSYTSGNGGGNANIADFVFDSDGEESTITIANHDMRIETTRDDDQDADIELNSADDIWINANDTVEIQSTNDSVRIITSDGDNTWKFNEIGELQLPTDNTTIKSGTSGTFVLETRTITATSDAQDSTNGINGSAIMLSITEDTQWFADNVNSIATVTFADNTTSQIESIYDATSQLGFPVIVFGLVDSITKTFEDAFPLTIVGEVVEPNVYVEIDANSTGWKFTADGKVITPTGNPTILNPAVPGNITLSAYSGVELSFADVPGAGLVFPDQSIQTTAYTGGAGGDLVIPTSIKDENDEDFITITRTNTGTARIDAPQDDLSLRSAADITLFAGTDGPGHVYIGWGDAEYTPDSPNRVATIGDLNDNHGDFYFNQTTLRVDSSSDMILEANEGDGSVASQIKIGNGDVPINIVAYETDESSYGTGDWSTAEWQSDGNGAGQIVLTGITSIEQHLNNFNYDFQKVLIDDTTLVVFTGASYGGGNATIYVSEGPAGGTTATVLALRFIQSIGSGMMIDYDDSEMNIIASDMEINITTTGGNDLNITSSDDLDLEASDDIRFSSDINGEQKYWSMDSSGQFNLPGDGYISNPSNSSGDGNGYDTIKIVPDSDREQYDQYLIIDPTQPNHIHVRAGGTQDESLAELIIGGEKAQVKVVDSSHKVYVQSWDDGNDIYHNWEFGSDGKIYGPGEDGAITLGGELLTDVTNMSIRSTGQAVVLNGELGEFLGSSDDADSQIATIGDVTAAQGTGANGEVTRWSPNFQATGLTFTGSGATYPTYNSHYVKNGRMVSFFIEIDLATVTNFGTGQYKTELPFAPLAGTMNHFQSWCLVDETANPDNTGHAILQADHLANTSVLDLHYIKQSGGANSPVMEALFKQGSPVTLTTATHVYINGTYITAE